MNRGKRGVSTLILVVIIAVAAVSVGAVVYISRPKPDFQVKNLSLSQDKIAKGDSVTAQVEVMNVGDAEGTHIVKLEVEGETLEKEVTLDPSQSRTVTFSVHPPTSKSYSVKIGDLSSSFRVIEPVRFEASNLIVSPKKVEAGEIVTVSVDVKNVGKMGGTQPVELRIEGTREQTENISLVSGERKKVSFRFLALVHSDGYKKHGF